MLQKKAIQAFLQMARAARKEQIELYILSATRNFQTQKLIWEAKFFGQQKVDGKNLKKMIPDETQRALKILEFSSMPGTSRHHRGTDFDISFSRKNLGIMLTNSAYEKGDGLKAYRWLQKNAAKFGFCQPYNGNPDQRNPSGLNQGSYQKGYQQEKWHWSYHPLSSEYLKSYRQNLNKLSPHGFAGYKAGKIFFQDFVFNINPECK